MTQLLKKAFNIASQKYNEHEIQNRLAYLMIENMDRLYQLLEEEAEEQNFDACAIQAVNSPNIERLFEKAAKKYNSQKLSL